MNSDNKEKYNGSLIDEIMDSVSDKPVEKNEDENKPIPSAVKNKKTQYIRFKELRKSLNRFVFWTIITVVMRFIQITHLDSITKSIQEGTYHGDPSGIIILYVIILLVLGLTTSIIFLHGLYKFTSDLEDLKE